MAQSRGRRGRALGQAGEAPLPRDKAPLSSLQLGRKGRGEGLVHGTAPRRGAGSGPLRGTQGVGGLGDSSTHPPDGAACSLSAGQEPRPQGTGRWGTTRTPHSGRRGSGTPDEREAETQPWAPAARRSRPSAWSPPHGPGFSGSVLQAWPRLSPQGAGPPAGEGVAPALIPLWGGPCCHKAQSRPRFGRLGWGRGRPQSRLTQGLFRSRSTPCPPHWRGSGVNTSCRYWTSRLFGRPEGGGARGGSGRVVQSPPAAGSCPDRSGQSHKPPRPQTHHPRTSPREGVGAGRSVARVRLFTSSVLCCRGARAGPAHPPRPPQGLLGSHRRSERPGGSNHGQN